MLFGPALENVEWLKQLAERLELQPKREAVEEYEAALAELWWYSLGKV